jgi:hypothetical protein
MAGAAGMLASPLLAAASRAHVPVVLEAGRFFAVPRVAGGQVMKLWLDTDGGGFVFENAVRRLRLPVETAPNGARLTRLPAFEDAAFPALGGTGRLQVFAPDRPDPILSGFDGQLGASWFMDRTWRFDYRRAAVSMGDGSLTASEAAAPLTLLRGRYPRVALQIGGTSRAASVDTAASVAFKPDAVARFGDGLPAVRATSFVRGSLLAAWHAQQPAWTVLRDVGATLAVDAIRVPSVRVGSHDLGPVWFTTRAGDDVFEGDALDLKLGAPAFFTRTVILDYRTARLGIA